MALRTSVSSLFPHTFIELPERAGSRLDTEMPEGGDMSMLSEEIVLDGSADPHPESCMCLCVCVCFSLYVYACVYAVRIFLFV